MNGDHLASRSYCRSTLWPPGWTSALWNFVKLLSIPVAKVQSSPRHQGPTTSTWCSLKASPLQPCLVLCPTDCQGPPTSPWSPSSPLVFCSVGLPQHCNLVCLSLQIWIIYLHFLEYFILTTKLLYLFFIGWLCKVFLNSKLHNDWGNVWFYFMPSY